MNYLKLLNKDNTADICSYLDLHEVLVVCQMRNYVDMELLEEVNNELFGMKLKCSICLKSEYVQSVSVCGDNNKCPICSEYFCTNCSLSSESLESCTYGYCGRLYHVKCSDSIRCETCNGVCCYKESFKCDICRNINICGSCRWNYSVLCKQCYEKIYGNKK